MTTKNRRAVGTLGLAAVVAVLAVSMIAMNFTSPVIAEHVPAKSGYVGGSEISVNAGVGESELIEPFSFRSNSGGSVLFDLTAECATMTHIEGKGKMKEFDGASVQAKVWFEWQEAGTTEWKTIPIGQYDETVEDLGKWNFCEQVFKIKTTLNELIITCEEAWDRFGDAAADACPSEDGINPDDPFKLVFLCQFTGGEDCEQAIELFLKTAGTRPATALLMNVPSGVHNAAVMTSITVTPQGGLPEAQCDPDTGICDIRTALMIGKRLLIVEDVHLANDAGL